MGGRPCPALSLVAPLAVSVGHSGYGQFLEPTISASNIRAQELFDVWSRGQPFPYILRTSAFAQANFLTGRAIASTTKHTASFDYWHRGRPFYLVISIPRQLELSYADFTTPTVAATDRALQASQAFLVVPDVSRRLRLSQAFLVVPDDPAAADKKLQLSQAFLTVPDVSRVLRMSQAFLVVPDAPLFGIRQLQLSWAEFSILSPGERRLLLSFAQLHIPDRPAALELSQALLEVPEFDRTLDLSQAQLVIPSGPGIGGFVGGAPARAILVSPIYGVQMTTSEEQFVIKQGDTLPRLRALAVVGENTVTIPANATVEFHMDDTRGGDKVSAAGTGFATEQTDDATGLPYNLEYEWVTADTDTAGEFRGEFQVTFIDGSVLTFPNDDEGFRVKIVSELS